MDGIPEVDAEDREVLRAIEMKTFNVVKEKMIKDGGSWTGTQEENATADFKVAKMIRNSFYVYEKSKPSFQPSYFRFK